MSERLERALRGLVLIGLALFLTHSIMNGTLLFYISRRFAWLTWIATILLVLMAFTYQRVERVSGHQHPDDGWPDGGEGRWITLALVAIPLLLGILVPPRPLGAQAVGAREVNTDGVGLGGSEAVWTRLPTERNILDWLRVFGAADDVDTFAGQEARVLGFVYRDDSFVADQFMVSRFVVSCCVADATVLGLVVSWPNSLDLPVDTWVEVQGTFQPGRLEGQPTPILVADDVTPTNPPNQPYLYP